LSAIDVRNSLKTYLQGLSWTLPTGATVVFSAVTLPTVETEKVANVTVEIYPLSHASARDGRHDWRRTQVIRLAVRYKPPDALASAAKAHEDQFVAFVESLQDEIESYGIDYVELIDNRNIFEREVYSETGCLLSLIDVSMVTFG
jgi:hypothetical protein